jgi:serine/threonine protein kinase
MQLFKGEVGEYNLVSGVPFAFGRSSLLFEASTAERATVALKVFRSAPSGDDSAQFFAEVRAHRALEHPNILPILDFGWTPNDEPDHGPFLVLPLCRNGNLRQRMKARDFFPARVVAPLLLPIASALDHAHENGVIHGDVKPENILFGTTETDPFLADFGVAKYFPVRERVSTVIPGEPSGAGSSAYMSPEQIEDGIQSPRSDIYSLAVVAFELLTGSLPFDVRVTTYRQMEAKIAGRLLDPMSLNSRLAKNTCNALMQALSTDRRKRPSSCIAFVQSLTAIDSGVLPPPSPAHLFVSYCHKDERWLRKIETVLKPLVRDSRISVWSDRKIEAGSNWRSEIQLALTSARIAVLLVSHDFLASDFIAENELPPLLAAAKESGVKIMWIAVSSSLYKSSPLSVYQAVNNPEKPLDCLSPSALNKELVRIAESIMLQAGAAR